jgi:hypothetical protein
MKITMELLVLIMVVPVWVLKTVASLRAMFRLFYEERSGKLSPSGLG